MLTTTSAFKTAIDADARQVLGLVQIDFATIPSGTVTASTSYDATNMPASSLIDGFFAITGYSTTGSIVKSIHNGWQGATTSDSSGVLSPSEVITVNYGSPVAAGNNIWMVGMIGYYPVNFLVEGYNGSWVTIQNVTGNTNYYWCYTAQAAYSQVRITISKLSSASSNARLLYFGYIGKVIFTESTIQQFVILEEASSESNNPVGIVTSNEITLDVDNEGSWFSLQNTNSPFNGLLRPKLKVTAHLGVMTDSVNNVFEMVQAGVFYIDDFDAYTDQMRSTITAYGPLQALLNQNLPSLMPKANITIATALSDLFTALGLSGSQYSVDATLDNVMLIHWYGSNDSTVGEYLQAISESNLCVFHEDRSGIIRVKDMRVSTPPVLTLNDSTQIYNFSNPQQYVNTYAQIALTYVQPSLDTSGPLVQMPVSSPAAVGTWMVDDISVSSPLVSIDYAYLDTSTGVCNSDITDITADQNSISLTCYNNSSDSDDCTLYIYGSSVNNQQVLATASDPTMMNYFPERVLQISTNYIQNINDANSLCNSLLNFAKDPSCYYNMDMRGNPSLEILDIVTIAASNALSIPTAISIVIIRQQITYDGGLSVTQKLRKIIT